jgi:hypothetical protein
MCRGHKTNNCNQVPIEKKKNIVEAVGNNRLATKKLLKKLFVVAILV